MFTLERIARCVQMNEPVLLCGETGKTFLSNILSKSFTFVFQVVEKQR